MPKTGVVQRVDFLSQAVRGHAVLDVGLGGFLDDEKVTVAYLAGDLSNSLHGHICRAATSVFGVDLNPKCVEAFRARYPHNRYAVADVTTDKFPSIVDGRFDLVILGDVIEHLDNFRAAIENLKGVTSPGGRIVITTVNAYSVAAVAKMFFRYESVHEEHTCYFSYMTLKRLFEMNGLRMEHFYFYNQERHGFDSIFDRISHGAAGIFTKLFPQFSMGVIAVASTD